MNTRKSLTIRIAIFVVALMLALPTLAFAHKGHGKGRKHGKSKSVFVNGHDARDGRTDGRGPRRGSHHHREDRDDNDNDRDDDNDHERRERHRHNHDHNHDNNSNNNRTENRRGGSERDHTEGHHHRAGQNDHAGRP